jgi:signal peptidase I
MKPSVVPGDSVVVAVAGGPAPGTGDIVAYRPPPGTACPGAPTVALGRVVGLPGQSVEGARGSVLVDGRVLAEPWLSASAAGATGAFGPVTVGGGDYFLLGDDRARACDSRELGPVPGSLVLGTVVRTVPGHAAPGSATSHPSPTASTPAFTT